MVAKAMLCSTVYVLMDCVIATILLPFSLLYIFYYFAIFMLLVLTLNIDTKVEKFVARLMAQEVGVNSVETKINQNSPVCIYAENRLYFTQEMQRTFYLHQRKLPSNTCTSTCHAHTYIDF